MRDNTVAVKERLDEKNVMEIRGGRRLTGGKVAVAGSSNQVTKCIIASLLTDDEITLAGAPEVDERRVVLELFEFLGGRVEELDASTLRLTSRGANRAQIPAEL